MMSRFFRMPAAYVRGLDRERVDQVAALVLGVVTELQVWLSASIHDRPQAAVAGLVLSAAVAIRRRWPFGALLAGVIAVSGEAAFGGAIAQHTVAAIPAAILVFYGAGAFLDRRRARLALGAGVMVLLVQILITPYTASDLFFEPVILAFAPWACGRYLRERSERVRDLRELSERLDAEREQYAITATGQERTRIARELHDALGHCLSVIVLQAGGARMLLGSEPARADAAMTVIERAGHDALVETRRLLGVLGGAEDSGRNEPPPGLADVEALVQRTRVAGLPTDLLIEGPPKPVSPALALCAYRIVQESLTNAIRHAGPARATVRLRWETDQLQLEIADNGRGPAAVNGRRIGHGLIGMRERAALHDGVVYAGAETSGGYLVRASLPLWDGIR
jgi:signal transduction histidine kinase